MTILEWLQLIAVAQGCYSLGLFFVICYTYWRSEKYFYAPRMWTVLGKLTSHCMLTLATVITMYKGMYSVGHLWYWLSVAGYILSNYFVFKFWRTELKNAGV